MEHQHQTSPNATDAIYTCPMHPEIIQNAPSKCPKCGMDLVLKSKEDGSTKDKSNSIAVEHSLHEKKAKAIDVTANEHGNMLQKYTCPMHPEIIQDQPGNCPKCRMTLVQSDEKVNASESKPDSNKMNHSSHVKKTDTEKSETKTSGSQLQKYTCPMHPHILQDGPGKCPLCGMTLEPVAKWIN